jgi:hypothetical protein
MELPSTDKPISMAWSTDHCQLRLHWLGLTSLQPSLGPTGFSWLTLQPCWFSRCSAQATLD